MKSVFLRKTLLSVSIAGTVAMSGWGQPVYSASGPAMSAAAFQLFGAGIFGNLDPALPPAMPKSLLPPDPISRGADVGYLPAGWNVTSSGVFTYSVPLDVPDGRGGMQPSLALSYSSSNLGNGPLGIGWSLSGVSAITRCGKTLRVEGEVSGVHYDSNDRFCLDGAKLVEISGIYGADGTEYRTENTPYSRIRSIGATANNAPQFFTVETSGGVKRTYQVWDNAPRQGEASGNPFLAPYRGITKISPNANPVSVVGTVDERWVLTSERDVHGNTVEYQWDNGAIPANNSILPVIKEIRYTSNPMTGDSSLRKVVFSYDDHRPDKEFSWFGGVRSDLNWRLNSITMYAPNPTLQSDGTPPPVWTYLMDYDASVHSHRSRLKSVQRCAAGSSPLGTTSPGTGSCLWKKEFQWNDAPAAPSFNAQTVDNYSPPLPTFDAANPYSYFALIGQPPTAQILDLDGDGSDDMVLQYSTAANSPYGKRTFIRRGERVNGATVPLHAALEYTGEDPSLQQTDFVALSTARALDLDGDGKNELVGERMYNVADLNGNYNTHFKHETRIYEWFPQNGTFGIRSYSQPLFGDAADFTPSDQLPRYDFVDLNGDGLLDAMVAPASNVNLSGDAFFWYTNHWAVWMNSAGTLSYSAPTPVESRCPASVTDQDGDGRGEFVAQFDIDAKWQQWQLSPPVSGDPGVPYKQYKCRGIASVTGANGAEVDAPWLNPPDGGSTAGGPLAPLSGSLDPPQLTRTSFGDFNGDGLEDKLIIRRPDGPPGAVSAAIRWNTGNGYTEEQALPDFFPGAINSTWTLRELVGDFNGDGRADVLSLRRPNYASEDANDIVGAAAGTMVLKLSKGDGFFEDVPMDGGAGFFEEAGGFNTTQSGDFNGDGFPDLVRFVGTQLQVLTQTPHYSDRINAVYDQHTAWPREVVTYSTTLSDKPEALGDCNYPLSCVKRGMAVVRQVTSRAHFVDPADEFANTRTLDYSYEGGRSDVRGRGFLGFRKFRTWDRSRPMEIVQEFDNSTFVGDKYVPGVSNPVVVTTVVPFADANGNPPPPSTGEPQQPTSMTARVTRTYTTNTVQALNKLQPGDAWGRTYDVHPTSWYTKEWEQGVSIDWGIVDAPSNPTSEHIFGLSEPNNAPRRVDGSATYDDFGNVLVADSATLNGVSNHSVNVYNYTPVAGSWETGKLSHSESTTAEADHVPADVTRKADFTYNSLGKLSYAYREKGNKPLEASTHLSYDLYGNVVSAQLTARNDKAVVETRTSRFEYGTLIAGQPNEHMYPSQVWSPDGAIDTVANTDYRPSSWVAIQPAYGVPIATMNVNGVRSRISYDDQGRVVATAADGAPNGAVSYAPRLDADGVSFNGLVITSNVLGQEAQIVTDGLGRSLTSSDRAFDGTKRHVDTHRDLLGRVVSVSRPYPDGTTANAFSTFTYDGLDRLLRATAPDGQYSKNQHIGLFETHNWDASLNESYTLRDVDGRTTTSATMADVNGVVTPVKTTYEYGPQGVDKVIDDVGNVTHTEYDLLGRPSALDDPDTGRSEVTYTGFNQVQRRYVPATAEVTSMQYDLLGRLIRKQSPDGITAFSYDTQPNGIGALARATSPDNVITQPSYEPGTGRAIASDLTVDGEIFHTSLSYDPFGRLSALSYPAVDGSGTPGMTLSYGYTNTEYLNDISYAMQNAQVLSPMWHVNTRNLDGALLSGTLGNNLVHQSDSYDSLTGRLQTQTTTNAGAALLLNLNYSYYDNGLVKDRNEGVMNRAEHFDYDALMRLTHWTLGFSGTNHVTDYGYDTIGNLKTVSAGHYPIGQIPNAQQIVETNTYGNPQTGGQPHTLTRHQEGSNVDEAYAYDTRGRQTTGGGRSTVFSDVDLPKTLTKGSTTWSFAYDAFGSRVKKSGGTDGTTIYVDGLYERRGPSAATAKHVFHVSGTDGKAAQIVYDAPNHTTQVEYTLGDALGSTNVVLDSSGQVTERHYFEPFGKRINVDGSAFSGSIGDVHDGLTGHEHEDAFGLINMKGRMYDPRLRRFISSDPFVTHPGFGQSWNHYSYVMNSPLNLTDPSGLQDKPGVDCGIPAVKEGEVVHCEGGDGTNVTVTGVDDHTSDPNTDQANAADQVGAGREHYNAEYGCSSCDPGGSGTHKVQQVTENAAAPKKTFVHVDAPKQERKDESPASLGVECPEGTNLILYRGRPGSSGAANCEKPGDVAHGPGLGFSGDNIGELGRDVVLGSIGIRGLATGLGALARAGVSKALRAAGADGAVVIGSKGGTAKGVAIAYDIAKGANPLAGRLNCVDCSIAGLQRLAGELNATAASSGGVPLNQISSRVSTALKAAVTVESDLELQGIVDIMKARGPGSTGIVVDFEAPGSRLASLSGHATVVVNDGGIIRFLDFQSGGPARYAPNSFIDLAARIGVYIERDLIIIH